MKFISMRVVMTTFWRRLGSLLLLYNIIGVLGWAQHPILHNYEPATYNGGTQNWSVVQGLDGRMLIGNNYGLLGFDGRNWDLFRLPNYTAVRAVHYDEPTGHVFVGGTDEFGYYAGDSTTGDMEYHSLSASLDAAHGVSGEVWNIFRCRGRIVVQTKERLFLVDGRTEKVVPIAVPGRIETAVAYEDGVVVAGKTGIWTIGDDGRCRRTAWGDGLSGMTVRAMVEMDEGLVFATARSGLFILRRGETKVIPLELDITPYLCENQIFCAAVSGRQMAIGTVSGGLVVKDFGTGTTTYANTRTGLLVNTVLSVFFDNGGNVWMGLDNGIAHMRAHACGFALTGTIGGIGTGYASAREGGVIFLGTNQGLYTLPYPLAPSPTPVVPQLVPGMTGQVWGLSHAYGALMACTDNGLFQMIGGRPFRIDGVDGSWNVEELGLYEGQQHVLVCDYQGFLVLRRDGKGFRFLHRLKGLDLISGNFLIDADGSVWIAHWQKGVYHLWLNADFTKIVKNEHFGAKNGLATDEGNSVTRIGGRIYVSAVGGIYAYDRKSHQLHFAEKLQHLFRVWDPAARLVETPCGDLFAINKNYFALARRKSAASYEVDELSYNEVAHGLQFGMGNVSFPDSRHTIFNTNNGFLLLDHDYHVVPHKNALIIRRILSTNKTEQLLYNSIPGSDIQHLKIEHSNNSLRIEFVLPEYSNARNVMYRCMLEGYDKEWSEERTVTSKEYTKLPKGRYTFRVEAHNVLTNEVQDCALSFEILPAWYETWWAYVIYAVLVVWVVYLIVRHYRQRTRRTMLRQMREQARIQRDERHRLEADNARKEREVVQLRNKQLELELKHRSSKLADSTTNLIRKNDLLQEIDERLADMASGVGHDEAKAQLTRRISELRRVVKSNMSNDDNWDKFEQNFNLVYDNFMVRLSERYPSLKPADKRICAYLRMGLSSKEMASLMNTAVRSIETARYRLRKKLDLDSGENLVDFIQNFENS